MNSHRATLQALQDELASLPAPARSSRGRTRRSQPNATCGSAAVGAALQSRIVWDRVLREISAVLPGDVWLTTLSAQTPETPTTVAAAPAAPTPTTTAPTTTTTTTTTTTSYGDACAGPGADRRDR